MTTCQRAEHRIPARACTHGNDVCIPCQKQWEEEENTGSVLVGPREARPAGPPPICDTSLHVEWAIFVGANQLDSRSFPTKDAAQDAWDTTWAETYREQAERSETIPAPHLAYRHTTQWEELPTGTLPRPGNWLPPVPEEAIHPSGAVLHARWRHSGRLGIDSGQDEHILGSSEGCESAQYAASVRATWETSHDATITRLERRMVTSWQHS